MMQILDVKRCGMACLKLCKQGRRDSTKAKVNILAKPHLYIFFTLQLDSIACLRAESAPIVHLF